MRLNPGRTTRRPFLSDIRFFIGVALVLLSIGGVWFTVQSAQQTSAVLAATRVILPGDRISERDLRVVQVVLGESAGSYLEPGTVGETLVSDRTIHAGELVPVSALAEESGRSVTRIMIEAASPVSAELAAGSVVELWATGETGRGDAEQETPELLVADAVVASVEHDSGVIGRSGARLELIVPRALVPQTLVAISQRATLSVLPVIPS